MTLLVTQGLGWLLGRTQPSSFPAGRAQNLCFSCVSNIASHIARGQEAPHLLMRVHFYLELMASSVGREGSPGPEE